MPDPSPPKANHALMLKVSNCHFDSCGKPPFVDADEMSYTSYFENEHGEQMIFAVPKGSKTALLYHGDCGWDPPFEIHEIHEDGTWGLFREGRPCGALGHPAMDTCEQLFITACMVSTHYLRTGVISYSCPVATPTMKDLADKLGLLPPFEGSPQ